MNGTYTITAPKTIYGNSKFNVAIASEGYDKPIEIEVGIRGKYYESDSGNYDYHDLIRTEISPFSSELIVFDVKVLPPGQYYLFVKGLKGILLQEEHVLVYQPPKEIGFLIETDSIRYKAGDILKFHVIVLDAYLNVVDKCGDSIFLVDPNNHKITQWTHSSTNGVFSDEFIIPQNAQSGKWFLQIGENPTPREKHYFEIYDYDNQQSKFEIFIKSRPKISLKDGKIIVEIHGQYPDGRFVKGATATVTVISSDICLLKEVQLNGKCEIEFAFKGLKLKKLLKQKIDFQAIVTDDSTKSIVKSERCEATVYNRNFIVNFSETMNKFLPGLNYTTVIIVESLDRKSTVDIKHPLFILWKFYINGSEQVVKKMYNVNDNGMVKVNVDIPSATNQVKYTAKYLDEEFNGSLSVLDQGKSEHFLHATIRNVVNNVRNVDKEIIVDIQSSEILTHFTYQIITKHNILATETIRVANKKQSSFTIIQPVMDLLTSAKIVVFYVKPSGDYLYDVVDLDVDVTSLVKYDVEIELSDVSVKPGGSIGVKIKGANFKQDVYLMAIEEKMYLEHQMNFIGGGKSRKLEEFLKKFEYDTKPNFLKNPFDYLGTHFISNYKGGRPKQTRRSSIPIPIRSMAKPKEISGVNMKTLYEENDSSEEIASEALLKNKIPHSTWIFEKLSKVLFQNPEHMVILRKTVPKIMTTWIFTAFTIDECHCLQIIQDPKKLEVFKTFYTNANLPFSIKFGETLSIPVEVYNNSTVVESAQIVLQLDGGDTFEILDRSEHKIKIPANDRKITNFTIKPRVTGDIPIIINAIADGKFDDIKDHVQVVFPGLKRLKNIEMFVDLREESETTENVVFKKYPGLIENSSQISLTISNDIMKPLMDNLSELNRNLYFFGDEELITFELAINVILLNYLSSIDHNDQTTFYSNLKRCYQHQLKYKQSDGSFNGDIQYTAVVLKFLCQASRYIGVDKRILKNGFEYLKNVQNENGSFTDDKNFKYSDVVLTSHVILSFLELDFGYKNEIDKAVEYLLQKITEPVDVYTLGLVTYVVLLVKHPKSSFMFINLQSLGKKSTNLMWWEADANDLNDSKAISLNIELTSYALLSYMEAGITNTENIQIMRWLLNQRKSNGEFNSLADTLIGNAVLSKIGANLHKRNNHIKFSIESATSAINSFEINLENVSTVAEIPNHLESIQFCASGHGYSFVKFTQTGYLSGIDENEQVFKITVTAMHVNEKQTKFEMTVAVDNLKETGYKTNPFVLEFQYPSGYVADVQSICQLNNIRRYKLIELETIVLLYFDGFDEGDLKIDVSGIRIHNVLDQKWSIIRIYDQYGCQGEKLYNIPENTFC